MTDELIIKNFRNGVYKNKPMLFGQKFLESVLDLINRQKAEIEEWKKKANTPFAKVTFDRDKLQEIVDECAKNIEIDINLAKFEAIKEFAHLVIDRSRNGVICVSDVPDLVKEMTEER